MKVTGNGNGNKLTYTIGSVLTIILIALGSFALSRTISNAEKIADTCTEERCDELQAGISENTTDIAVGDQRYLNIENQLKEIKNLISALK